jgi:lysophospholipase L1-like esterase
VLFGTVTGRIVATIADRLGDPDVNPDVVPVTGRVRFTPSVDAAISSTEGAIVLPTPIEAVLDSQGYLSVNGIRGVSLVATNSPDLNPTGFTYTVSFLDLKFDKFPLKYNSFNMALPAGSTVDLTTATPVGASNGAIIIRGLQGEQGVAGPPGINAVVESLGEPPAEAFYDAKRSLYNFRPSHFRRTRAAIARSQIGQGSAKLLFEGDSNTLGLGPLLVDGDAANRSYAARFRDIAASRGMTLSGDGLLFPAPGGDSRLTGAGSVGQVNPLLAALDDGASLTFVPTRPNNYFAVTYLNDWAGSLIVTIDGGTPTTIERSATGGFATWTSPSLSTGNHTIKVAAPVGTSTHIASIEAGTQTSGPVGLRIGKAGVSGSMAVDWVTGNYNYLTLARTWDADLVSIMLGTNDAQNSTIGQYIAALTQMIGAHRADGADVLLIAPPGRQEIDLTDWWTALYALALELDVPLLDLRDRQGPYSVSGGYFIDRAGDTVHLSSQAHDDLARALLDVIL